MDKRSIKTHKQALKKNGILITGDQFKDLGRNINVALAGALTKILGIPLSALESEIKSQFKKPTEALEAAEKGYKSYRTSHELPKLKNHPTILAGSQAIFQVVR